MRSSQKIQSPLSNRFRLVGRNDGNRKELINLFTYPLINFKSAFTLAEVLITLGIIGVVAAMTIPNLIYSYNEKIIVNKLPEVYSILNQAYKMATEEYGPISAWNLSADNTEAREQIIKNFSMFMKSYLYCDDKNVACKDKRMQLDMLGKNTNVSIDYNMILGNTVKINFDNTGGFSPYLHAPECDAGCYTGLNDRMRIPHTIMVNVTGKNKNPRWGEDLFLFAILDRGIVPYGDVGWSKEKSCNPSIGSDAGWWQGAACAGYVLKHKNLNYMKCVRGNKKYCTGNYSP